MQVLLCEEGNDDRDLESNNEADEACLIPFPECTL